MITKILQTVLIIKKIMFVISYPDKDGYKKLEDKSIFEEKYIEKLLNEDWLERTEEEKDKVFNNYMVYILNGKVLGGFGLSDIGDGNYLLECLFSDKKGIGPLMIEEYIKKQGNIYAYSKLDEFFINNGFIKLDEKSKTGANLYLLKYL